MQKSSTLRALRLAPVIMSLMVLSAHAGSVHADGLVGDGKTDNTAALMELFGDGKRSVTIPPGDYVTGKLTIPGDIHIVLSPGVTLRDSGHLGPREQLLNITSDNVRIIATGAHLLADRASYNSGEQRHGVRIYGAHNVDITGLDSSGHSGDGFYIGGPPGDPATNIVLRNVTADNNRRQGLSITCAKDVRIVDSTFSNTNGTSPQFGLDIEPNAPNDILSDIKIRNVRTYHNTGGGLMIELSKLRSTSANISIDIDGHESTNDGTTLALQSMPGLQGHVRYANVKSTGAASGAITLLDPYANGLHTELSQVDIIDSNTSAGTDPAEASAIVVRRRRGERADNAFGNVSLNKVSVTATDERKRSPFAFWIDGPHAVSNPRHGQKWNGLAVEDLSIRGVPTVGD